jgi:hypothetical protein
LTTTAVTRGAVIAQGRRRRLGEGGADAHRVRVVSIASVVRGPGPRWHRDLEDGALRSATARRIQARPQLRIGGEPKTAARGGRAPMPKPTRNRRRKLIVNGPMQGRMMLNMALLPAVAMAVIAVFTAIYCSRLIGEAMEVDQDLPNLMPLFYLVITVEMMAAVIMFHSSLMASHRVAGPAYRICKSLERIRSGDLAFAVTLRKGDHLTEVKDEVNKLLDWLNQNPPPGCTTRAMATAAGDDVPAIAPERPAAPAAAPAEPAATSGV